MKTRASYIVTQAITAGLTFALASGTFALPVALAGEEDLAYYYLDGEELEQVDGESEGVTFEDLESEGDEEGKQAEEPSADELQSQLQVAYGTLGAMYDELEQAQANLSKLTYDIEQTEARIDELTKTISQNDASLSAMQKDLADSISQSYKAGKPSLLDFFLGSQTIEELTSNIFYQNKVAQHLSDEISSVRTAQKALDNERVELETLKVEQEKQRDAEERKSVALEEAAKQQKVYIDQLNDEIKVALESERLKKAEEVLDEAQKALESATNELEREAAEQARNDAQAEVDAATQARDEARSSMGSSVYSTVVPSLVPSVHIPSTATVDQRTTAVNAALSQLGTPYVFGCETPGVGFDCNGLAHWSWQQAGVEIPYPSGRTMYGQFQWLRASGHWVTNVADLLPGDLVFFSKDGGQTIYHVAMYVGGGLIVHAVGYQWGVMATSIDFCAGFCGGGSPL